MPMSQLAPTTCLGRYASSTMLTAGCLFRSYPAFILTDKALAWMGDVFAANDMDNRARVLGVFHDFLASEVEKRASIGKARLRGKGS